MRGEIKTIRRNKTVTTITICRRLLCPWSRVKRRTLCTQNSYLVLGGKMSPFAAVNKPSLAWLVGRKIIKTALISYYSAYMYVPCHFVTCANISSKYYSLFNVHLNKWARRILNWVLWEHFCPEIPRFVMKCFYSLMRLFFRL